MATDRSKSAKAARLRQRAEATPWTESPDPPDISPEDLARLVYELQAHQIELEMQNEELRVAQEELAESRDDYSDLYDFAPVGYLTLSNKSLILQANLTAAEMLGVERSALIRERFAGFVVDEDQDVFYRHYRGLLKTRGRQSCELRMHRSGEGLFWAELESVLMDAGDADGLHTRTVVNDITERRRAEEDLRKEHNFAESLIETAQAIVLVLDTRGRIVRFNRYMEELSGHRLADARGKDWFDTFLPRRDRKRIRALFARALSDVQTRGNINPIVTSDGRERLIEWNDKCLEDAQGNLVGVVVVGQDITERKQTEEALQRARDELENRVTDRTKELAAVNAELRDEIATRRQSEERERQLMADLAHIDRLTTMGEMASSLAHELNQPLGAIVLEAEVLRLKAGSDPPQSTKDLVESLARIAEQSHRAGDLIRRMRQFAKHTTPKRTTLTLAEVVSEVLPLVAKDLREAGIAFTFYANRSLPPILADKLLLQQVLLNLIRNAIEAMESTEFGARRLDIQTRVHDDLLEVAVRDTGCGIPPDKAQGVDNLFRTFYSTKPAGMGMGLWISRSIIESHGGHIRAEPNPDGGAVFTFTLPIPTEDRKNEAATNRLRHR